ncbi:MAG: methyltransferase domain-containing protein [Rhodospirillaceae bacterium]|nr:methyltransferase domain-containing protein [Rhodospirillaceae bacterium]
MNDPIRVFDRRRLARHRDRAAARLETHGFLFETVGERLADRLDDIRRRFPFALDLGCHDGILRRLIGSRGGIETLIQSDLSERYARAAARSDTKPDAPALVADEEALPFAAGSFDLALSNLSLHWVNDLPGALLQIRHALKPDGLFLATMFGSETLGELRDCLLAAESALVGGAHQRVAPFADLRDAAGLLQRAGFALPVADSDTITVTYENAFRLMDDLRGMGEQSALLDAPRGLGSRQLFVEAARLYAERHAEPDGRIRATFRVVFLTGWAPHESQQKPLRPGSAQARLAEALDTEERPAGDKAKPN